MPSPAPTRILLVEDTAPLARVYREYLEGDGYEVELVETGRGALSASLEAVSAIILDLKLPDMDGLEVLRRLRRGRPDIPVVVVTAHGSVSVAVEAMRDGAFDFLVKPFNAARLTVTVRNACNASTLTRMVERYRREFDRDRFHGFIGASPQMQAVYRMIETAASSRAGIFLTGESGTGKELAAEAVHAASPRHGGPFVAINCAAIPKDLLESEIFGHVRGAFTGAATDREGAARQADRGTLFLDEICEMPLELQPKILRFLQTGTVQPVGESRPVKVDVRIVAATNRDPLAEVQAGRFREDLYYRLHVIPIALPPLRERERDAVLIARSFLTRMAEEEGKSFQGFTAEAEDRIAAYAWPGNVRQLENLMRHAVVMHDGPLLTAEMLPEPLRSLRPDTGGPTPAAAAPGALPAPVGAQPVTIRPLWMVEKEMIQAALVQTGDDVPKAAALLEISPSTIYRKLQIWKNGGQG